MADEKEIRVTEQTPEAEVDISEFATTLQQEEKEKRTPEEIVMAIIFALLLFFGGINVILRYAFNTQIPYVNDMMVDVFAWLTLIGFPVACYREANMSFALINEKLNKKAQLGLLIFNALLSIALFVFIFYSGAKALQGQIKFGYKTVVPFIPKWFWTSAFPVVSTLYVFRVIQVTIKNAKKMIASIKEEKK